MRSGADQNFIRLFMIGAAGTGVWMAKEIGALEKYGLTADLIYISSDQSYCKLSPATI